MPLSPRDHPNASVAMIAGAVVSNVVWILDHFHVAVPAGIAAGWVTLMVGGLLYLGRNKPAEAAPVNYDGGI